MSLASGFAACPRVHIHTAADAARFWEAFSDDPQPAVIVSDAVDAVDFVADRGAPSAGGVIEVGELIVGGDRHRPYVLTNIGYTPRVFDSLSPYPLPAAAQRIDQRAVFSIGLNGTGERDLAHHYHPVTAMRLLQGRKIWALRSPMDPECSAATGDCTDPFDVCAYYARAAAPPPARACTRRARPSSFLTAGTAPRHPPHRTPPHAPPWDPSLTPHTA
jgi:hypothetical protein